MKLAEYLAECGLTQPEFAERLGVSQSTVSRWCNGIPPRRRHLEKLKTETGGKITLASFDVDPSNNPKQLAEASAASSPEPAAKVA